ncbi:hypothetical protein [Aeromonas simiae]|uniref:hypothetical protein n=1 Tax=Aeromonas simiae TaxID=218936 RepID=UPI0005AA5644|nr:hypothetical protein [Aeromonas simiae]MDO2949384.1 hypothetical protein [Aeromonas simiae]MDO2952915.1 hypothetical protein [Aeromonas simiae]MDO2956610.1 hypothetical protein [Aeromonas simiae]
MKTAWLLIASWLLILQPTEQGWRVLGMLLLDTDRELYGTGQLAALAGMLLTLYLANLGVEVVLRRRFQSMGMFVLFSAWLELADKSQLTGSPLLHWLSALPFLLLCMLVLSRSIQACFRTKG